MILVGCLSNSNCEDNLKVKTWRCKSSFQFLYVLSSIRTTFSTCRLQAYMKSPNRGSNLIRPTNMGWISLIECVFVQERVCLKLHLLFWLVPWHCSWTSQSTKTREQQQINSVLPFKKYFAIVFSVISFQFSANKRYPNKF